MSTAKLADCSSAGVAQPSVQGELALDEDRITGSAQKLGGSAKEAVGRALGDAKLRAEGKADQTTGMVRNAVGGARDEARDWGDDAQGELAHLRDEVDRLAQEPIAPVVAGAAATIEDYTQQARDTLAGQAEQVSALIKGRPLIAIGLAAAVGYLIGRLSAGTTYVYRQR
jgi:uncharacterized protein YjbJ (UPF0337 family)